MRNLPALLFPTYFSHLYTFSMSRDDMWARKTVTELMSPKYSIGPSRLCRKRSGKPTNHTRMNHFPRSDNKAMVRVGYSGRGKTLVPPDAHRSQNGPQPGMFQHTFSHPPNQISQRNSPQWTPSYGQGRPRGHVNSYHSQPQAANDPRISAINEEDQLAQDRHDAENSRHLDKAPQAEMPQVIRQQYHPAQSVNLQRPMIALPADGRSSRSAHRGPLPSQTPSPHHQTPRQIPPVIPPRPSRDQLIKQSITAFPSQLEVKEESQHYYPDHGSKVSVLKCVELGLKTAPHVRIQGSESDAPGRYQGVRPLSDIKPPRKGPWTSQQSLIIASAT